MDNTNKQTVKRKSRFSPPTEITFKVKFTPQKLQAALRKIGMTKEEVASLNKGARNVERDLDTWLDGKTPRSKAFLHAVALMYYGPL